MNKKPCYTICSKNNIIELTRAFEYLFSFTQVGVHGITVCLSASGICNIINILRQNLREMLFIFSWFTQVEVHGINVCLSASGICNIIKMSIQNLREILYIFSWFTQVGVHGITVCLSTSGICNITNNLRQNFRQMLISFPGSPRLESMASPYA